jgi:hypothetical protein
LALLRACANKIKHYFRPQPQPTSQPDAKFWLFITHILNLAARFARGKVFKELRRASRGATP